MANIQLTDIITMDGGNNPVTGKQKRDNHFRIFGRRTTASTALEDVWEGPTANRPWPADAGTAMEVVSTSADDAAAGTGARTVDVYYLDPSGNFLFETVTLNGITPVALTATPRRIMGGSHASSVGSGGVPAGTIKIQSVGGATVYEQWATGNRSLSCARTVPAGKVFYCEQWHASVSGGKSSIVMLRAGYDPHHGNRLPGVMLFQDAMELSDAAIHVPFQVPLVIPALTDIEVVIQSAQAGARVAASVEGWLSNA